MARIRTIKPEFWSDEDLSTVSEFSHMLAAALLNYADDQGFFNANPRLIEAFFSPIREPSTSIRRALDELSNIGFLALTIGPDKKTYGKINNFNKHQRIDRPSKSKISDLNLNFDNSTNTRRGLDEGSTPEIVNSNSKGNRNKEVTNVTMSKENLSTDISKPNIDYEYFKNYWNENIRHCSKIVTLSKTRKDKIKTRLKADPDFKTHFDLCVQYINQSDFYSGKKLSWRASFDYVIENDNNYLKILERTQKQNDREGTIFDEDIQDWLNQTEDKEGKSMSYEEMAKKGML